MKTATGTIDPQALMESVTLARNRLEYAENEYKAAKKHAKQARHQRKEAKLLARRAKKQTKQAASARAAAKHFLADVEANLAKSNGSKAAPRNNQPVTTAPPKNPPAPAAKSVKALTARPQSRKSARRNRQPATPK